MAENLQLGIKITADAAGAKASIASTAEEMQKLARASTYATRKAAEEAKRMASSWAELGKMGQTQLTAIKTAQRLTQGMSEAGQAAQRLKDGITGANQATQQLAAGANKSGQNMGKLKNEISSLSAAANIAAKAFAALGVTIGARELLRTADAYTNLTSKLKVVTGTTEEFNRALRDVSTVANQYQQDINSVGAAYNRLGPIVANMGKSQQDVADAIASVSSALKLSGATTTEASETLRQFGQALSGPTVQMEEMNTIIDSASVLWQGLQRQFPQLIAQYGSLKEAVGKGALSNRDLLEATIRLRAEFDAQANTMNATVAGAMRVLSNEWEKYIGNADQAGESSKSLANGILLIAKNMETLMYLPAKMVEGWGLIFEAINKATTGLQGFITTWKSFSFGDAVAGLFSPSPGGAAPNREEYMSRYGVNPAIQRTPDQNAPRFDGVNRSINTMGEAADQAGGKVKKLKADLDEGIEALARKWKLNSDQIAMAVRVYQEAQRIGVDPNFAVGLSFFESGLKNRGPNAAGARGPMQVIGPTFNRLKRDYPDIEGPNSDALSNIRAGLHYIKEMAKEFGSYKLAAAGYLAGEGAVRKARGMPHKVDRYTGVTTEQYADRVMKNAGTVASLLGGSDLSGWEKTLENEQKRAFDLFASRLDRQARLADAERAKELQKQKIQLEALGNEYKAWEDQSSVTLKVALEQGSYESQIQLINDAQTQAEKFIQDMNRLAGGEDSARVKALTEEIKLIDQKIAKVKQTTQDEDEIAKLQGERDVKRVEREKEVIAAQAGGLELQRALAENEQKYRGIREQAMAAEIRNQDIVKRNEQENFSLSIESRQQQIALERQKYELQYAGNEQARQAALVNKTGYELGLQYLANEQQRTADRLALIGAEKAAALAQLELDREVLQGQEEYLRQQISATKNREQQLTLTQQLLAVQMELANVDIKAQTVDTNAQKQAAGIVNEEQTQRAQGAIQKVAEEQLRLNQTFEDGVRNAQLFAAQATEAFGAVGASVGRLIVGMAQFSQQTYQVQRDLGNAQQKIAEDMRDKRISAEEGLIRQQEEYRRSIEKTAQLQIQLYGDMASAAKGFFKENTSGYRAMENAEKVFRMFQMAMAIKQVGAMIIGNQAIIASDTARTVTEVANSAARGQAKAAEAVANQASGGDPYSAFFRLAAMAAVMAAIGFAVAGATAGSGPKMSAEDRQKTTGAGTVFGDSEAQSSSLSNSLEIIAENSSADLAYSAGMLRALKNIEMSMAGVTNSVIRGVGPVVPQGVELGSGRLFAGSLFSSVKTAISDYGIQHWGQEIMSLLMKGFQANVYTEITKTTKVFGMVVGQSVKMRYSELDKAVANDITRVFVNMADSLKEAGKAFGIEGDSFAQRMRGFVVNLGMTSLKGLKGEELERAITAMFSKAGDQMAQAFMPGLEAFQRAGQGYLETLMMVADGVNVASGMLAQAGLQAINYQEIVYKQGDIAAEIVRQSIVAFEGVNTAIGAYVDQAVGSAEELMSVYQDMLVMSDVAQVVGFNFRTLTNDMVVVAGGVNKFLASLQTYQTDILGAGDYASQVIGLQREFRKLGIELPRTNAEFVRLVDSISTATPEGARLYAQVMNLAAGFAKAQKAAADLAALQDKYNLDPLKSYKTRITDIQKDFDQIIQGVLAGMPGGADYVRRNQKIRTLDNRIGERLNDRADKRDELQAVQDQIDVLEAKGKLTQKERTQLANLRMQRKAINGEIAAIDAEIGGYRKQIDKINERIRKDPNNEALLAERNRLIEEQGSALLATLSDIFDQINQSVENARDTLQSIRDNIYELSGEVGGPNAKAANAAIRAGIAGEAYRNYQGDDIGKRTELANKYRDAIMAEYEAKKAAIEATKTALEKERDARQKAHDEEIGALQKQLDKARELNDAIKSIQKFARDMLTGGNSPLSPRAQLQAAQQQYQELLTKANAGDVTAMQNLGDSASSYLEAARKYYGSGGQFGAIFDGVQQAMESLGAMDPGDQDSIQAKIDELNRNHEQYLKSIDEQIAALKIDEQIKTLQDETIAKLDALEKSFAPAVEKAAEKAKEQMAELIQLAKDQNILNDQQLIALGNLAAAIGIEGYSYRDPASATQPPAPTLPAPTDDWVQRLFDRWNQGQTGYRNPLPAFASGGMAQPGWALVGEEGPELVRFGSQAMVYDAEATGRMLREMASFQPVMPEAPRPINLAPMPRYINDTQGGKPINLERMPRVINDLPRRDPGVARLSNDEVITELRALRTELRALVTTQSRANPAVIEQLANIERRLGYMERDQKLKPA